MSQTLGELTPGGAVQPTDLLLIARSGESYSILGSAVAPSTQSQGTINTTTYTLALSDAQLFEVCNNALSQIITVPTNASVAFPVGTEINFFQQGAGQVTFAAAGGVTIQSVSGFLNIANQYGAASLKQISIDTWALIGNLS